MAPPATAIADIERDIARHRAAYLHHYFTGDDALARLEARTVDRLIEQWGEAHRNETEAAT